MARFRSFFDFVRRVRPQRDELEALVMSGAMDGFHPNRRALLWAIPTALRYADACAEMGGETRLELILPEPPLPEGIPDFSHEEKVLAERSLLDLDVKEHLMALERPRVHRRGGITTAEARYLADGTKAVVVGNPIRLRFPPTPSGKRVVFFDLEDETGLLNVTCFDAVYRRDGHALVCSAFVTVIGNAQDRDGHIAFLASSVFPYRPTWSLAVSDEVVKRADFLVG